jgi:hypothetical protein
MSQPMSLLEFLRELFTNVQMRDYFLEDPHGALEEHGLGHLSPADVHDALVLIEDTQTADFSRDYNTGDNSLAVATPPPPPAHFDGDDHEAAVQYLNNYITNNYVTDNDTIVDNSVNQQIDTGGGDFEQDIDIDSVVASGDGAVAAGDDIEDSTIVTGDDNLVGEGNVRGDGNVIGDNNQAVTGDDNTTSFGSGDASSTEVGGDVNVGAGGAFSSGGDAEGGYDVDGSFNETETTNTSTVEYDDSFNQDNDTTSNSHNETETSSSVDSHDETENHTLSHNDVDVDA